MANMDKLTEILNCEKCVEELKAFTTKEAVLGFLNEKGADVAEADLKAIVAAVSGKEALDAEELTQVSGGSGITTDYIHSDCGGTITCEDHGVWYPDIWMECQKCGKQWHPHSPNKVGRDSDIYTFTVGTF